MAEKVGAVEEKVSHMEMAKWQLFVWIVESNDVGLG
jgi:hypothetical protein